MRKILASGLILVMVSVLAIGFASPILAQTPEDSEIADSSKINIDQPTLVRIARALGLTREELLAHLQEGESISAIAAGQNISENEVIEAIIAPYRDELQLREKYGYISQEQADALLEQAREHARDMLDADLSNPEYLDSYSWEEMVEDCNENLESWGDSSNGWGGIGGHMMGGYWNGPQNGWGGMMRGWGSSLTRGWGNMMRGWGNISRGLGGMMGGGWAGMM